MSTDREVIGLGQINKWPDGFAMTIGMLPGSRGALRCCTGHETPEEAKNHGIVRLLQLATEIANVDLARWAESLEDAS